MISLASVIHIFPPLSLSLSLSLSFSLLLSHPHTNAYTRLRFHPPEDTHRHSHNHHNQNVRRQPQPPKKPGLNPGTTLYRRCHTYPRNYARTQSHPCRHSSVALNSPPAPLQLPGSWESSSESFSHVYRGDVNAAAPRLPPSAPAPV